MPSSPLNMNNLRPFTSTGLSLNSIRELVSTLLIEDFDGTILIPVWAGLEAGVTLDEGGGGPLGLLTGVWALTGNCLFCWGCGLRISILSMLVGLRSGIGASLTFFTGTCFFWGGLTSLLYFWYLGLIFFAGYFGPNGFFSRPVGFFLKPGGGGFVNLVKVLVRNCNMYISMLFTFYQEHLDDDEILEEELSSEVWEECLISVFCLQTMATVWCWVTVCPLLPSPGHHWKIFVLRYSSKIFGHWTTWARGKGHVSIKSGWLANSLHFCDECNSTNFLNRYSFWCILPQQYNEVLDWEEKHPFLMFLRCWREQKGGFLGTCCVHCVWLWWYHQPWVNMIIFTSTRGVVLSCSNKSILNGQFYAINFLGSAGLIVIVCWWELPDIDIDHRQVVSVVSATWWIVKICCSNLSMTPLPVLHVCFPLNSSYLHPSS